MFYLLSYSVITLVIALLVASCIWFARKKVMPSIIGFLVVTVICSIFYFAFLDNFLARRWGGTLVLKLPQNAQLIAMTWKENSLWYQYYLPETNECVFREDAPIGIVEGEVRTPNCNPVGVAR